MIRECDFCGVETDEIYKCATCGDLMCEECFCSHNGRYYCEECLSDTKTETYLTYNGTWATREVER